MSINGIIPVNKPAGFTSFDVVAKMRGILKIKRIGHAGTLDPMATGVLPVFVGTATKACDILPDTDKTYIAGFALGMTTDTQDISGKVLSERSAVGITASEIENQLPFFRGDIKQLPPMYSAVSVGGKRLYELARKGIEIEREARDIHIDELSLLNYDEELFTGTMKISCSKGTYIRTIINDIGERLSCGAVMTSLVRTAAAGFSIEECVTLDELQQCENAEGYIIPIERVFENYTKIFLDDKQAAMYKNGIRLDLDRIDNTDGGEVFSVYGGGEFLGVAVPDREKRELIIHKNFYDR